jgi:hypothetical protein
MKIKEIALLLCLVVLVFGCSQEVQEGTGNNNVNFDSQVEKKLTPSDGALIFDINEKYCSKIITFQALEKGSILGFYDSFEDVGESKFCDPFELLELRIKELPTNIKFELCLKGQETLCDIQSYNIDDNFEFNEVNCDECKKEVNLLQDIVWCEDENLEYEKPNSYTLRFSCTNPVFPR